MPPCGWWSWWAGAVFRSWGGGVAQPAAPARGRRRRGQGGGGGTSARRAWVAVAEPGRTRRRAAGMGRRGRHHDARIVFFFQAEDGIRDLTVTGVQTCALPI